MSSKKNVLPLSPEELAEVHKWIKKFRVSKDIKGINRDFSDGVLVAEILKQIYPKLVDLHNYPRCNSRQNKLNNWQTLNRKVLNRLNICLAENMMLDLANGDKDAISMVLYELMAKQRLESYRYHQRAEPQEGVPPERNNYHAEVAPNELFRPE